MSSILVLLVGAAYFVDLFLRWAPRHLGEIDGISVGWLSGWELGVTTASGATSLGLVLVESLRLGGLWRTAGASVTALALAAASGVLGIGGWLHLRWGSYFSLGFDEFAYGAWIGFGLAIVLLLLAAQRVFEIRHVVWVRRFA
jgi:hypothetical protein